MGCLREIAAKIVEKGADYVLALKGNQGSLRDDVELFFTEQKERRFADAAMSPYSQWTGFEDATSTAASGPVPFGSRRA